MTVLLDIFGTMCLCKYTYMHVGIVLDAFSYLIIYAGIFGACMGALPCCCCYITNISSYCDPLYILIPDEG